MGIENVIFTKSFDLHTNEKRTITNVFKPGEEIPIKIEQVRLFKIYNESFLGNHWREYGEIYSVIGESEFFLEDIHSKERKSYLLNTGDRLYIPKEVALKFKSTPGTFVVCCSERNEREKGTHKYEF